MDEQTTGIISTPTSKHYYFNHYSINSDGNCFFVGHASNSEGTTTMTALQRLMNEAAELEKQLEAAKRQGEEQKARIKNFDPKVARMLKDDFEGMECEELIVYNDTLVEMHRMIKGHNN